MNPKTLLSLVVLSFCTHHLSAQSKFPASNILVAVEEYSGKVAFYDLRQHKLLAETKVGFRPHELTIDKESRRAFVANFGLDDFAAGDGIPGNTISVIDLKTFKEIARICTSPDSTHCKAPHGIRIRPNKRELFTNTESEDSMLVYDLDSLRLLRKFALPEGTHDFSFTATGDSLWLMAGKKGIYYIDPNDGTPRQHMTLPSTIRGLSIHGNKLVASMFNEIDIIDLIANDNAVVVIKDLDARQLICSAITEDGQYIFAPYPEEGVVLAIDAKRGSVIKRFLTGQSPTRVVTSNGLAYVSNTQDRYISIIDIEHMKLIGTLPAPGGANGIGIVE